MPSHARFLAASCSGLVKAAVVHSTEKSARRKARPVSNSSHEKARKAAEETWLGLGSGSGSGLRLGLGLGLGLGWG